MALYPFQITTNNKPKITIICKKKRRKKKEKKIQICMKELILFNKHTHIYHLVCPVFML